MQLLDELKQQPKALRQMAAFYEHDSHLLDFFRGHAGPWVLTGMGASYHTAWIAALYLNSLGVNAAAVEATDLFNYYNTEPAGCLVYISQSGSSGEVALLQEMARPHDPARPASPLIAITNHLDSPLASCAGLVLPMLGGDEAYIASKTYTNTLAILWLIARQIAGERSGSEWAQLSEAAAKVEANLSEAEACAARLAASFDLRAPVVFLGHGPHAATARQASMIMSEWAKVPALNFGIGAFRHGFIEAVQPGTGVVIFSSPGRTHDSACKLASELAEYGARVLRVENGRLLDVDEVSSQAEGTVDEFLVPLLDIIPIQIWTESLARARGIEPGFRYIHKVVRNL